MKITRYLVPGLLAGSLLAGGTSGVFAAQKKVATPRAFAYGQVSNLSNAGFSLTWTPKKAGSAAPSKVVQVALSSKTKEKARKGTTGALTNGEYAFVVGVKGASGMSANRVLYSRTAFKAHRLQVVVGLVNGTATTPTTISITTAKGKTLAFAMTPQTKYRANKVLMATPPTFFNGEKVRVRFAHAATKGLTARVITIVAAH